MSLKDMAVDLLQRNIDADVAAVMIVSARNDELMRCDWTQAPDAPLTDQQKEAWRLYRQQLRDITNDPAFPFIVDCPVPPLSKVWTVDRTRSPELEEEMRLEREALEAKAREMQKVWDAMDVELKRVGEK